MYNESVKSIRELAEQRVVIRRSFACTMAIDLDAKAIVVNSITEPFFLGSGICPLVESMQPRMIREKDPASEDPQAGYEARRQGC